MNLSENELHKTLIEHASDIISLHELDGKYVYCSPYCIEITGYNPSELIGKSPYEFIHPDDIEKVVKLHSSIQKSDFPAFVEYRFKSKSGDFVWLQTSFRTIALSGNCNKAIIATTRDFTGRKELEEDLLKSQQLLNEVGSISSVGGWLFEIDTKVQKWTEETYNIHEVDADFVPTVENGIDFFVGESKNKILDAVQRAIKYGESYELELEIMTAKGNLRTVHTKGEADLKNRRVYGAIQDITARKKLEEKLRKNQQLLEETSKIGRVGGWEVDLGTEKIYWTDEVYHIHELEPDFDPNLEAGINFYSEESRPVIAKAIQRAIEENESYDLELEIITAKGNSRNVRAIGIPDLENNRLYGFFQDITEKLKLQEAQLRSSQLSALGEVAAGVAHEINNPINGVINYAQLLINKNDPDDKSNLILERIIKEGSRISSIVRNLLNFAQNNRDEFEFVKLIDTVVEPINLTSQLLNSDGISVEVNVPDDLPGIYGNKMQIEQVVLNLLSNARYALNVKFPKQSDEKVIEIEATSSRSQSGEKVQLNVKDYGCGIPKEHLDKIFNPFFTTKEAGVGTGLGMSISHDILEKHNATISVESRVNQYTIITITFPANPK